MSNDSPHMQAVRLATPPPPPPLDPPQQHQGQPPPLPGGPLPGQHQAYMSHRRAKGRPLRPHDPSQQRGGAAPRKVPTAPLPTPLRRRCSLPLPQTHPLIAFASALPTLAYCPSDGNSALSPPSPPPSPRSGAAGALAHRRPLPAPRLCPCQGTGAVARRPPSLCRSLPPPLPPFIPRPRPRPATDPHPPTHLTAPPSLRSPGRPPVRPHLPTTAAAGRRLSRPIAVPEPL